MIPKSLTFIFAILFSNLLFSQTYSQYFDGADTMVWNSLIIELDTSSANVWQIGPPQKEIFNNAASQPNVIVTDTINFYPTNNNSSFRFDIDPTFFPWGILAVRWKQKLDMDYDFDGGIVDYSINDGQSWQNVFNDPYVYNFYGFDPANEDTLTTGEFSFSGIDTLWRDVWLCFDVSWLSYYDTLSFRFTLKSDSIDNDREGWMIDNIISHITLIHTTIEVEPAEEEAYMTVTPNPTSGKVDIKTRKVDGFHILENIELVNAEGKIVQKYYRSPTKFSFDISHHPPGIYFLKVESNIRTEVFKVILQN